VNELPNEAPLNRAARRAAEKRAKRKRAAGAVLAASAATFGTTAAVLGVGVTTAGAVPLTVTNLDPSGAGSLHDVAEAANDGDVITFEAGLSGTIFLDDTIDIDTSVTIQGPGSGVVTVSGDTGNNGSANVQLFNIDGPSNSSRIDVVISGLTLTMGTASIGGAIQFEDANLTVQDSVLTGNHASNDGGAIGTGDDTETLTITNSTLSGNTADDDGGAVYFYVDGGTFIMSGSTVSENTADDGGGGGLWIGAEEGTDGIVGLTISNSTISGNTAGDQGGGLYGYYITGPVLISNTTISGNHALGDGGGGINLLYASGGVTITGSVISDNDSAGYGGGIYFEGAEGGATISFTTIANNHAGEGGGGIEWYASDGTLQIRNSTISGNTSDALGGGIYVSSSTYAPVEIFNSTISGNTAADDGGGISFASYYGMTIVQSTIVANTGASVDGVFLDCGVEVPAAASQRHNHNADKAGALAAEGKDAHPRTKTQRVRAKAVEPVSSIGSIISANGTVDIGDSCVLEAQNSLLGTISGTTLVDQGGNLMGVEARLGPLADNGGPTQTHELLPGSPAINAGPNPLPAFPGNEFDQRGEGYARVVAGVVDIGAYEVQPIAITPNFTG